jgi:L-cysteine:1D-myo-inositol 2-amino-2-deoxy-alpha-D-glucopyranoside ligase
MRSWASPQVPSLADLGLGRAPLPRLHDTASGGLVELDGDGPMRLYVCGITPYDATHLGHAATYIAYDVLQRVWRDAGVDVSYTQNVTDVDDPLLERARVRGEEWAELAGRETELFREDMEALRVLAPDAFVGAVESVPQIVALIERLRERGAAYDVDGDLYFDVRSDPEFGAVSGCDEVTMRRLSGERGGDPDRPGKRDALDCLLWRRERAGEPAWDSPFGRGRPGWHVECAAMALETLGLPVDVQGGGTDLIFPHHELTASQAQVAMDERPFARAYVHAGMVGFAGEKMSKSRGNLVLVSELRKAGQEPAAMRLAMLSRHYRHDREWANTDLLDAEARLVRWREAVDRSSAPDAEPLVRNVREALADDLDTPRAIAGIDVWAESALAGMTSGDPDDRELQAPALVRSLCDALLGLPL